jgi:hypothetical protein
MTPLSEGWRDQYERMLRSRARLAEAAGPSTLGSDEARDRLYSFFQDAYHLKDWLIHDLGWYTMNGGKKVLTQAGRDLENHITATRALANCADLCNGVKHLVLNSPRIAGTPANLASQSVGIVLGPFESAWEFGPHAKELATPPAGSTTAEHSWLVEFNGRYYDAVRLADEVVAEWQRALRAQGLLY